MQAFKFNPPPENLIDVPMGDPRLAAEFGQIQATAMEYLKKHAWERGFVMLYVAGEDDVGIEFGEMAWLPSLGEHNRRMPFIEALGEFTLRLARDT